jgi:hypothetical protein
VWYLVHWLSRDVVIQAACGSSLRQPAKLRTGSRFPAPFCGSYLSISTPGALFERTVYEDKLIGRE